MKIVLDKRFKNKAAGRYGDYAFQVGILKNAPHYRPKKLGGLKVNKSGSVGVTNLKSFHGGPARAFDRKRQTKGGLAAVSKAMRRRKDYLKRPFISRKNSEIRRLMTAFLGLVQGRSQAKRVRNALQAIVRNPILRGDYGPNSPRTVKIKGFDRYGIDTGQFFKAIQARVTKGRFGIRREVK